MVKDSTAAVVVRLEAENNALRDALQRAIWALETCGLDGEPHPTHDAVIAALAKVTGSGGLMQATVYEWRRHLAEQGITADNHFTVGPTRYTVQNALAVGRAALGWRKKT